MNTWNFSCARNFVAVLLAIFVLTGCFGDSPELTRAAPTESVHDVDWFKTHDDERQSTLRECSNNPAELRDTPNCINALQAERSLSSGESFELDLSGLKNGEES